MTENTQNLNEFGVQKLIKALKMSSDEAQDEVVNNYELLVEEDS